MSPRLVFILSPWKNSVCESGWRHLYSVTTSLRRSSRFDVGSFLCLHSPRPCHREPAKYRPPSVLRRHSGSSEIWGVRIQQEEALDSLALYAGDWFTNNKVKLNIDKSLLLYSSPVNKLSVIQPIPLSIGDCMLDPSATVRILGVL